MDNKPVIELSKEELIGKVVAHYKYEFQSKKDKKKNKYLYKVLGIVKSVDTEEDLVIYQALYESKNGEFTTWARSYKEFIEEKVIDIPQYAGPIYRFTLYEFKNKSDKTQK